MIRATSVTSVTSDASKAKDTVTLSYDDRFRRRIALKSDAGLAFLLDLPKVVELREGQALVLDDGQTIRVIAAPEALMQAHCDDPLHLTRTAWHVGNRHLPAEIHKDHLVLRWDHVIADMLSNLGCEVTRCKAPFNPESGAYGQGRTHGHAHH